MPASPLPLWLQNRDSSCLPQKPRLSLLPGSMTVGLSSISSSVIGASVHGCFGHFESLCSYLTALMEGKSEHHGPFPKLYGSSLPPSSTAFMGVDSSPCPQIHKVLSLFYLLYQPKFPPVNSFWLAGLIYCCLWRQDNASPGVQQARETHCLG